MRGLHGITAFPSSFQGNLCTSKLVKLDFIFARVFFSNTVVEFCQFKYYVFSASPKHNLNLISWPKYRRETH